MQIGRSAKRETEFSGFCTRETGMCQMKESFTFRHGQSFRVKVTQNAVHSVDIFGFLLFLWTSLYGYTVQLTDGALSQIGIDKILISNYG